MLSRCLLRFIRASRQGAQCFNKSLFIQRTLAQTCLHNKILSVPQNNLNGCQIRELCTDAVTFESFNVQDTEDFQKRVLESSIPVVIDFHATWCGPCKILGPRLESIISQKGGKVALAKIDVDDNAELAIQHAVASVPTVVAVKDGKIVDKFVGLVEDDKLNTFVEKLIN